VKTASLFVSITDLIVIFASRNKTILMPEESIRPSLDTLRFIKQNAEGDTKLLALRKAEGVDMPFALDQIAGRQTARKKLPSWAAIDGIVYPPRISMEQCSSERTARYKASVARRLAGEGQIVDITGGFGVDFAFMSEGFSCGVYVERQERLCSIARNNFKALGLKAEVVCADGTEYLRSMARAALVFIDPARRDANGGRTFGIADCTPDVLSLKDTVLGKADFAMIKLSPMLDWRKAVADIGDCVGEVHIVSVGGECKDLLLVMSNSYHGLQRVYCVNDDSVFDYPPDEKGTDTFGAPAVGDHLYEPNASVMKAGCFSQIARRFGVRQIARNSHLFVSSTVADCFPGRGFTIDCIATMNKKGLKTSLKGISKANITVRNFPLSVAELRKRLKIGEGGSVYIFATTLADKSHVLLICSKVIV